MDEDFPTWLARQLTERRMSQNALGRTLGVARGLTNAWLNGNHIPNERNSEALAALFRDEVILVTLEEEREARRRALGDLYADRYDRASKNSFAGWLAGALREKGMSRNELSRQLGVSVTTVSSWSTQRKFPSAESRAKVAQVLGVPVSSVPKR